MKKRQIYWFLLLILFQSCMDAPTCDELAVKLKDQIEYNFILTSMKINGHDAYLFGNSVKDKSKAWYLEGSGWIARNADKFKVGDTVFKEKGKYSVLLRRKNKKVIIPCQCGIHIYQDTLKGN